jgi:predicted nucleic acid-binding protein
MILADTSVWVEHFRRDLPLLASRLEECEILMHTVVLGELATGNLFRRSKTLAWLRSLPMARHGTVEECLAFIESERLWGRGVGWNDVQLLAAARLSNVPLWSLDLPLIQAAQKLGIAYATKTRLA